MVYTYFNLQGNQWGVRAGINQNRCRSRQVLSQSLWSVSISAPHGCSSLSDSRREDQTSSGTSKPSAVNNTSTRPVTINLLSPKGPSTSKCSFNSIRPHNMFAVLLNLELQCPHLTVRCHPECQLLNNAMCPGRFGPKEHKIGFCTQECSLSKLF